MKKHLAFLLCALILSYYFLSAQQPKLILPVGHTDVIYGISFSPDSKYIVTASADNTAKLWDAGSGKFLINLSGHTQPVNSANFSHDGKYIATASYDSTVGIWEAATGKHLFSLPRHSDRVHSANFSPDGKFVLTMFGKNKANVWETSTGKLLYNLVGGGDWLDYADFSPTGKFIVTSRSTPNSYYPLNINYFPNTISYTNSNVRIWETATGKLLNDFSTTKKIAYAQVRIGSPGDSSAIIIKDSRFFRDIPKQQIKGHPGADGPPVLYYQIIDSARVSSDQKFVLTLIKDSTARVWEAATGKLLYTMIHYNSKVRSANFSPDGKSIIMIFDDGRAKIWKTFSGELVADLSKYPYPPDAANFSTDGKFIAAASGDSAVKIWEVSTGNLMHYLKAYSKIINFPDFSPDGNFIMAISDDSTASIWQNATGKLLYNLPVSPAHYAGFSADSKFITTELDDSIAKVREASTGLLVDSLKEYILYAAVEIGDGYSGYIITTNINSNPPHILNRNLIFAENYIIKEKFIGGFDPGDKYIVMTNADTVKIPELSRSHFVSNANFSPNGKYFAHSTKVWNASNGTFLFDLKGHTDEMRSAGFSPDGKYFVTSLDTTAKVWDVLTGKLLYTVYPGNLLEFPRFSPDGKYIITKTWGKMIIWNASNGDSLYTFFGQSAEFSPDSKYVAAGSAGELEIVDVNTWKTFHEIIKRKRDKFNDDETSFAVLNFSHDGKSFIIATYYTEVKDIFNNNYRDNHRDIYKYIKVLETATGKLLDSIGTFKTERAEFSHDGKYIVTGSEAAEGLQIWDTTADKPIEDLKRVRHSFFSTDGKYAIGTSDSDQVKIIEISSPAILRNLEGHSGILKSAEFSSDGKYIVTISDNNSWHNHSSVKIFETSTARLIHTLEGHTGVVNSANFSPDGKYIITASADNTAKTWEVSTGRLLYTLIVIDSTDYVAVDTAGHFDGTDAARKLLYYVCGTEIIDLDQFKDLCWEPGLVSKIMGTNKEPITAKKLSDINICNYTPEIADRGLNNGVYQYQINPRSGGIGEVQLYVNGKLVKKIDPSTLPQKDNTYSLSVNQKEIDSFFVSGNENQVLVKATTKEGSMTSRGVIITTTVEKKNSVNPNMYIVAIGISQYKGDKLKLGFASKDATDFASTLRISAGKLLNTDGKQHVTTYTFNTEAGNRQWPAKQEIESTLASIAQKATADDILVIFFAGHGFLKSGQKNFYLITAEATSFEQIETVPKDVSISTEELNEWMRKIKANKQLLILDACNSGQVVQNLQDLIAKRDVPADQQRALEDLKDKTGTFILAASASDQSAYETSLFGQGLLTYSLLSAIKLRDGLINNYIDVTKWFNIASENVQNLAKDIGGRQDPKIIGSASFDVGLVDQEVMDGIKLSIKKKIFRRSKFIQDEALLNDDLFFSDLVDKELNNLSNSGKESPLAYAADNTLTDAYSIRGKYEVKGNIISASILLFKGQAEKVYQFKIDGSTDKKEELAWKVVQEVQKFLNQ